MAFQIAPNLIHLKEHVFFYSSLVVSGVIFSFLPYNSSSWFIFCLSVNFFRVFSTVWSIFKSILLTEIVLGLVK